MLCRWLFRARRSVYDAERAASVMRAERARGDHRPARCWSSRWRVLALVVVAFVLHPVLHYEPSVVALLGAGLLAPDHRARRVDDALQEVEWPTLVFFAGLFIMVGGAGRDRRDRPASPRRRADATEGRLGLATMLLLCGSAVLSAIVDNIPYVATMSPIVAELVATARHGDGTGALVGLALGADLGGNATAIGASANVVVLGHRRAGGPPDRLLGVHEVRPGRHRGHRAGCACPTCGCATSEPGRSIRSVPSARRSTRG